MNVLSTDLLHARLSLFSDFEGNNPKVHFAIATEERVGFQDHFCQTLRCRSIFGYVFLQLAVVMQYHRKMQSVSTSLSQICPVLRGSTRVRIIEQNLSDVLTVLQGKDDTFRMLLHHFN